jgi:L-iditol 2-dehydrogenase
MKALQYLAPGDLRLVDISRPECQADTMILKILSCAICGTDLKTWKIGNPRISPPNVIGHELVGEIIEMGETVRNFNVGQRITLATTIACGKCYLCRDGRMNICQNAKPIGFNYPGGFAEYLEVPALAIKNGNAVKVPANVDEDAAALCEPLSCAIHAQKICGVGPGQSVLVVAAGPLGCLHIECAKAFGAATVVVSEPSQNRRGYAEKLGVDANIDCTRPSYEKELIDVTGGVGYDVVIIAAPVATAQEEYLQFAKKGGTVNLFASLPEGHSMISIDSRVIHYNELRLTGSSDSSPADVRMAMELISAGKINTDVIITHRLPLEQVFEGLKLMEKREGLKIIIKP